jgi:sortase B
MSKGKGAKVVRSLRSALNYALVAVLCLPLVMGCYALWDSHVISEHAGVEQWQPYKPTEPEPLSFWELQRINPEVRAWLSVYGTNIDYPVCQPTLEDEEKYLTTNAKGEYNLGGALFIGVANDADFSDFSTIVYGHHMENKAMFGGISDFADQSYFDEHRYGNLFVNDRNYGLEFFCYLNADAYDRDIYRFIFVGEGEREGYISLLHDRAQCWRDGVVVGEGDRIVMLSTCSEGYTNAREILVGKICNDRFKNPFVKIPNLGTGVDKQEGWFNIPYKSWLGLAVLVVLVAIVIWGGRARRVR